MAAVGEIITLVTSFLDSSLPIIMRLAVLGVLLSVAIAFGGVIINGILSIANK